MPRGFNHMEDSDSDSEDGHNSIFSGFGHGLMRMPGNTCIQMQSNFGGGGGTVKTTQMSYQTYIDENGNQQIKKMERTNNRHVDDEGNIMEDREELFKDSEKGINQMKKGRRINERGMQITKENRHGEYNEFKQFHNMDEDDMDHFIQDWRERGEKISRHGGRNMIRDRGPKPLAITYQEPNRTRHGRTSGAKRLSKKSRKKGQGSRRRA